MKNILALLLLLPMISHSQNYLGSAQLGGNFGTFDYGEQINNVDEFDNSRDAGLSLGGNFAFPIVGENVYFTPGAFYQANGSGEFFSFFDGNSVLMIDRELSLNYIGFQFPLEIAMLEEGFGFVLHSSLFVDYAFSGNVSDLSGESNPIDFESTGDQFDYGFNLSLSLFQGGNYGVEIGYHKGMKNIEFAEAAGVELSGQDDGNYLINNNGFTIRFKAAITGDGGH